MAPLVSSSIEEGVARIVLDRPAQGNALGADLVEALLAALDGAAAQRPRALILTGAGKGFCGGFDLSGLDGQSDGDLLHRFARIEMALQAIHHFPAPVLAMAHGFAWGAGADIFCAAHVRIAAPGTRFSFPGSKFGIVLGTRRLRAIVGAASALDLVLSGAPIDADRALSLGIAQSLVAVEDWSARQRDWIAGQAPLAAAMPAMLSARMQDDARDADLAALVRSAAAPGLKDRLAAYADAVARARAARASA
jgi:enoyl-CoA hydratase